jgi:hypothetical protein
LSVPGVELLALVLIIAIRGLVPLLLLRWPFWGALACIVADVSDSAIQDLMGVNILGGAYHSFDKAFDIYYLSIEAWLACWRWADPLARPAALALFLVRLTAAVAFELTHVRALFLIGANVFENFYLYIAARLEIDPAYRVKDRAQLALILVLVGAPKLLQEYVMHYREAQTWRFVTRRILTPW